MTFRQLTLLALFTALTGCAFGPRWHWEKAGASNDDYDNAVKLCKLQVYSGTDVRVTKTTVAFMHACLQAHGWHRVRD